MAEVAASASYCSEASWASGDCGADEGDVSGDGAEGGEAASAGREGDEEDGPVRPKVGEPREDVVGACNEACMVAICCLGRFD